MFFFQMYPKGHSDESKDYVSLFLNLCISGSLIVDYRFAIVDADGVRRHAKEDRREFHYYVNCSSNRDTLGFDKFVSRDFLLDPANRLLPDNKLTLYCEVRSYDTEDNFLLSN